MSLLQLGHALFQPGNARLEFRFVDDAFGIAVDEPADPAPQAGYLTIEVKYLVWRSGAIARLSDAPTVFMGYAIRLLQESFHLVPNDLLQLVAAHGSVVAHRRAAEPVAVGASAAIIAQNVRRIVFARARSGLAIICVAAAAANRQALQKPGCARFLTTFTPAILLELRASKLEHSWINKGGNGYLNPLFRGHGDSGSCA